MPNHCENHTTFLGAPKDLAEILEIITLSQEEQDIHREPHRLANLIPMPTILEGTTSPAVDSPTPNARWAEWVAEGKWTQEELNKAAAERVADFEKNQAALKETGYSNWYDWCVDNWGTKWGDYDHIEQTVTVQQLNMVAEKESISFSYNTAWGPFSTAFWAEVSRRFPNVRIEVTFYEPGMCFAGAYSCYQGFLGEAYAEQTPQADWEDDDSIQAYFDAVCALKEDLALKADQNLIKVMEAAEASV
jgi:hypothetical protein